MYLNGEARVGEETEAAHIDLLIGDKEGPVGQAFATSLANPVPNHATLFAIIAPNVIAKPVTLLVPKVSITTKEDAKKIFGPAQKAIAMAVSDCVDEGTINDKKVEDLCIICGVLVHPKSQDLDRIYRYNYEATKIAIRRAFHEEPSIDEILEKKDITSHPFYKIR